MQVLRLLFLVLFANCLYISNLAAAEQDPFPDTVAGDPNGDYANVEFSSDGKYMVWLERSFSGGLRDRRTMPGTVWHCAFDVASGTFNPPDCRGFNAFPSTLLGRANPGEDASGDFYAGLNETGQLVVVRPTGPTTGERQVLPLPADITRRAIYAADTPDRKHGWIFFIKNEKTAAGGLSSDNAWFELRAVDLGNPTIERVIVRQEKPARGFAPMDVAFARFIKGTSKLTFGMKAADGYIQVAEVDMDKPDAKPVQVTFDPTSKIDPYGLTFAGREWLLAGIGGTPNSQVYSRPVGATKFEVVDRFGPGPTMLSSPWLAQSHEPFVLEGHLFSAFEVNDHGKGGKSFFNLTFSSPGEIYIATIGAPTTRIWRASPSTLVPRTEPEPVSDGHRAWIFYNVMPGGLMEKFALHRIEVHAAQLIGPDAVPSVDGHATATAEQSAQGAQPERPDLERRPLLRWLLRRGE